MLGRTTTTAVLIAGVLLALAGACVAAPAAPQVITQPNWMARPSSADLETYYPTAAWALELGGKARLACGVEASGALSGCRVVTESPPELGFGPAALRLAGLFRMRPKTANGAAVGGGRIEIPIVFRMPVKPPPPPPSAIDPEALDLARQLVAALPKIGAYVERVTGAPPLAPDAVTPPATRAAAIEALQSVMRAHRQELLDLPARAVALTLDRDELQAWLDAARQGRPPQAPPGETFTQVKAKMSGFDAAIDEVMATFEPQFVAEAQATFCRTHACAEAQKPPVAASR